MDGRCTHFLPDLRGGLAAHRSVLACIVLWVILVALPGAAHADGNAVWRWVPVAAPAPPAGVAPAQYSLPLGSVGQISFWAPNRGLLITSGTAPGGAVASGLYAYNGVSWHPLASVCGGGQGRIAWAGPDEFWTISDQRAGQITAVAQTPPADISLCHFRNGQVVGSYAMPLGEPESYLQMDAAACLSASDCWFAGEDGHGSTEGSFHLHWDGANVTASYDSEDHAVTGMANFQGKLYEGLAVGPEDSYSTTESAAHPAVIRTIAPAGPPPLCSSEEAPNTFCNVFLFSGGETLPVYPPPLQPDALGGFDIATDGSPLGEGGTQLWAGADPAHSLSGGSTAPVTFLREAAGNWEQLAISAEAPLPSGAYLNGSPTDPFTSQESPVGNAIAPEPGTNSAWLSLAGLPGEGAAVARIEANEGVAKIVEKDELPGPQDPVGDRGEAGPITCPAIHDCWMATSEGSLFHLSNEVEPAYPLDTDPNFAGVITERPRDGSVPVIYPDEPPVDDSLANQQAPPAPTAEPLKTPAAPAKLKRGKPLLMHVKSKFLHRRILVIAFTLTARAHVQLVGRRNNKVVASTREQSLHPGRHQLSLSLNPAHWPNKLQFKATPIGASAPSGGGSSNPSTSNTISTG